MLVCPNREVGTFAMNELRTMKISYEIEVCSPVAMLRRALTKPGNRFSFVIAAQKLLGPILSPDPNREAELRRKRGVHASVDANLYAAFFGE
jgi:hypothetical protein